jgi:hypothetical protein
MGAKLSSSSSSSHHHHQHHFESCRNDPALQMKVMEYLQEFDAAHSKNGRRNRRRGEIDQETLLHILGDQTAMDGLLEVIRKHETRDRISISQGFQSRPSCTSPTSSCEFSTTGSSQEFHS